MFWNTSRTFVLEHSKQFRNCVLNVQEQFKNCSLINNKIKQGITMLWANSADKKLIMFFLFFPEIGFEIHATICIKCQSPFSGKNKKNISIYLLKILPRVLSVKGHNMI